jgi:hypothetical protein
MIGIPLKYNIENEEMVKALAVLWSTAICLPSSRYTHPKPSVACLSSLQSNQQLTTVLEKTIFSLTYSVSLNTCINLNAISYI